ncbi:MAG: iron-sulfur cluster-binding protein [Anaerolineae bacterium CG2_30_64_16]|nr:MAG: iron-sulfur cluster-binding protein [Anaerolineae bacterium CG2_30_64_16]
MIPRNFPGKGKVAVLRTSPETVLDDIGRLMEMAGHRAALPTNHETILKINISWQTWYPACSSTPWQIEGVIRKLKADGYTNLSAAHNKTVVVDAYVGERNNKHKAVVDNYGLRNVHLYEPEVRWVRYTPKAPMLVLDKIFPDGILLPEYFFDRNIIQLPTVKTHVFTTITGAMKNAFGGLLNEKRHWTHSVIHETVVDLLAIQQEIHSGLFAVMDGTFAGDGPGPRAMRWYEKDILLASADQVAIDAISAKIQGFNPLDLKFIRLGHELGLGVGDPKEIEVVGYDVSAEDWRFVQEDTFASKGQKLIYHGPLKPFENILLRSPLVPWSYFASNFYHNVYWYPVVGRKRVAAALNTRWGQKFREYGDGKVVMPGVEPRTAAIAGATALGLLIAGGLLLLGRRHERS